MKEREATKVEKYEMIKEIIQNSGHQFTLELIDFIECEIEHVKGKNKRQIEYMKRQKDKPDPLYNAIQVILRRDYMTIDQIAQRLDKEKFPYLSNARIAARLTKMVHNGDVKKKRTYKHGSQLQTYALNLEKGEELDEVLLGLY